MVLYLCIIFVSMVILSLLNIFLGTPYFGYSPLFVVCTVIASTLLEFIIDLIFAFLVNKLPNKWFRVDKKVFWVSKKEQKFYEKLRIRSWKDKVWELGGLGGFRKNKIRQPNNVDYIERFIIECNKGVVTHRVIYFAGFLVVFLLPLKYAPVIGVPVALVNLVLNALPTMVLRYNTPKLHALYKWLKKEELKKEKEK